MKQQISTPVAIVVIAVVLALIAGFSWYFSGNRYAEDGPHTVANAPTLSPGGIRTGGSAEALSSGRPARPSASAFNMPTKK